MLGWMRRSPTWTDTWALVAATVVFSMCPDRGCWRSGSTTGPPERVIRCCTPIWWWPTGSRGRTAAGRPWTAGTCTGIGWPPTPSTGPPTSASCPGHSESSGRQRTPMATASSKGCPRTWSAASPSAPARLMPSWTGWGRTVEGGHRGWSSGPCTRLESRRSMRRRTANVALGSKSGRSPSEAAVSGRRLFDRLAGPDGLTATASTFACPEVLVALGAGLAGVGRAVLEGLADRFLAERAVSVVADRRLEERRWSTPDLLAVEQRLVDQRHRPDGRAGGRGLPSGGARGSGRASDRRSGSAGDGA